MIKQIYEANTAYVCEIPKSIKILYACHVPHFFFILLTFFLHESLEKLYTQ